MPNHESREAKHSSDTFEHGSPSKYVEAARLVLGEIELDPASSARFNTVVQASEYFDVKDNGLRRRWCHDDGRPRKVFFNPPGGLVDADDRPVFRKSRIRASCSDTGACGLPVGHKHHGIQSSASRWWFKGMAEYDQHHVEAMIYIGFTLDLLVTTQDGPYHGCFDTCVCIPRTRIDYLEEATLRPQGQPAHPSFIAYVGSETQRFREVFEQFGTVR